MTLNHRFWMPKHWSCNWTVDSTSYDVSSSFCLTLSLAAKTTHFLILLLESSIGIKEVYTNLCLGVNGSHKNGGIYVENIFRNGIAMP